LQRGPRRLNSARQSRALVGQRQISSLLDFSLFDFSNPVRPKSAEYYGFCKNIASIIEILPEPPAFLPYSNPPAFSASTSRTSHL
jgi:hypothetical protein